MFKKKVNYNDARGRSRNVERGESAGVDPDFLKKGGSVEMMNFEASKAKQKCIVFLWQKGGAPLDLRLTPSKMNPRV